MSRHDWRRYGSRTQLRHDTPIPRLRPGHRYGPKGVPRHIRFRRNVDDSYGRRILADIGSTHAKGEDSDQHNPRRGYWNGIFADWRSHARSWYKGAAGEGFRGEEQADRCGKGPESVGEAVKGSD